MLSKQPIDQVEGQFKDHIWPQLGGELLHTLANQLHSWLNSMYGPIRTQIWNQILKGKDDESTGENTVSSDHS